MRVLHISFADNYGAGISATRLNKALQEEGVDSRLLVKYLKNNTDSSIYGVFSKTKVFIDEAIHKLLRLLHIYVFEKDILIKKSIEKGASFSIPITSYDISIHPLIEWADIIHLHWVDNFFNQKKLLQSLKKPVVWTIHDEGFFYGISHYRDLVDEKDPIEIKYSKIKKEMLSETKSLSVVFLTKQYLREFGDRLEISRAKKYVIGNSIDCRIFYPRDKYTVRQSLGLSREDVIISFVASDIYDSHKGLAELLDAVNELDDNRIKILAIGNPGRTIANERLITTGIVKDPNRLSELLSSSDYYAMVSKQESFSQTCIEALACGIPVVSTPTGISLEIINQSNGIVCDGFCSFDIKKGLLNIMSRTYNSFLIRNDIQNKFSSNVIAQQYIEVYNKALLKNE